MGLTVGQQIGRLRRHFDRQPVSKEKFDEYQSDLAAVPPAVLDAAVTGLIRGRSEPWFPTLGEIRAACAEVALDLPTEAAALEQIEARIRWARVEASRRGDPPEVHPLVRRALAQAGGYVAFRQSDEPAVVRGQFGRLFRELRAAAVREAQLEPALEPGKSANTLPPPFAAGNDAAAGKNDEEHG